MKKLFIALAIILVIVVGGLAALVLLINPNQFKPLIVDQTKQATGLDLVIDGDIHWQFFPSLGFAVGKTEMRNPQGYAQANLFEVNAVDVSIEILPLLSQQLKIGNITLDGAAIQLETLKDGSSNLDSLTATSPDNATETATPATSVSVSSSSDASPESQQSWTINVAGVSVKNSTLEVIDRQSDSSTKLQVESLSISEFSPGAWSQLKFNFHGSNNGQKFSATGSGEFNLAEDLQTGGLKALEINATYQDAANNINKATLSLDQFELGKAANLTFDVSGQVADMELDLAGQSQLLIDPEIKSVKADGLKLQGNVSGAALPVSPVKLNLAADVGFDVAKSAITATLKQLAVNDLSLDGDTNVTIADVTKVRFNLHSANVDLDALLGLNTSNPDVATSNEGNAAASEVAQSAPQETEPDLSALKSLDIAGNLAFDKFKANNVVMSNMAAKVTVKNSIARLDSFNANLYQGTVSATGQLDARKSPATYSVKKTVKGVQVDPLLVAVADIDRVSGTGNIVADISGKSLMPTAMKKNLEGTVEINFTDGAVKGANIAQMIRTSYAKIKGKTLSDEDKQEKQTDFSALTSTMVLKNGVVSTSNLVMQSPLLRIHGKGESNYVKQTINFWLDTSVVSSLEGQGGKDVDDLKDLKIPVEIKGTWSEPNIDIALDVVLKERAKKQLDKEADKLQEKLQSQLESKLEEKLKDDKAKEAVNKLLKGLF